MTPVAVSGDAGVRIRPMTGADLEEIRKVGQDAWSDMASRDLGRRVWYPPRSKTLIDSYMLKEPGGCLVAEYEGRIISSAYSHVWGRVGWIGPLEVLPEYQNRGVGKVIVTACEGYLRSRGCEVIGVETMSHVPKNLHFYLSVGFAPNRLTLITEKTLEGESGRLFRAREIGREEMGEFLLSIASLSQKMHPLLDYSIEFEIAANMGLGSAFVVEEGNRVVGAALLHTYRRQGGTDFSSMKIVMVDPEHGDQSGALLSLVNACESRSGQMRKSKVYARFAADNMSLYEEMARSGYRIVGTNIRMTKPADYREDPLLHVSSWAG